MLVEFPKGFYGCRDVFFVNNFHFLRIRHLFIEDLHIFFFWDKHFIFPPGLFSSGFCIGCSMAENGETMLLSASVFGRSLFLPCRRQNRRLQIRRCGVFAVWNVEKK